MRVDMKFSLCLAMLIICSQAACADWKEFRGPTGQGEAPASKLPINWSGTENVLWKSKVDGLAWSSPVILGDKVYLTTAVENESEGHNLNLVCLNVNSGKLLWEKTVIQQQGKAKVHKKNSHASPTPIIEDNRIYVHFGPYGTACTTLEGEVIWKQQLEYRPVHGNGGSPVLAGNVLIFCCDGGDQQFVVGLDKSTGEIRWKTDRDTEAQKGFSFSTPLLIDAGGRTQVVCPGSDAVFSYDPQTGKEIWRVDYPGGFSVVPRPVFGQGLVFICTGFNTPSLLAIDPTGTGNVTETHLKWKITRKMPNSPSPLLVGEELYVVSDSGFATCIDAKTGEIHWQERIGGNYTASPMVANGKIYFQDEDGTTVVVNASKKFEEITRNSIGKDERTFASYAIEGDSLLLRSEHHLYRIGEKKN